MLSRETGDRPLRFAEPGMDVLALLLKRFGGRQAPLSKSSVDPGGAGGDRDSVSVAFSGHASASVDATDMVTASFDGWIEPSGGGDYSHCESSDHRLTLIPDPRSPIPDPALW